jgi:hypothetical protein
MKTHWKLDGITPGTTKVHKIMLAQFLGYQEFLVLYHFWPELMLGA